VESASYAVPGFDNVPYVDVVGTLDESGGTFTLFALNRDLSKARTVDLQWQDRTPGKVVWSRLLTGDDLKASNSFAAPLRVVPQAFSVPTNKGSHCLVELPPRSYAAMRWSLA
jgi:alpha-N-arabinofuranosidase